MIKTIKENKNYKKNSAKTNKNKQNEEKKSQQKVIEKIILKCFTKPVKHINLKYRRKEICGKKLAKTFAIIAKNILKLTKNAKF